MVEHRREVAAIERHAGALIECPAPRADHGGRGRIRARVFPGDGRTECTLLTQHHERRQLPRDPDSRNPRAPVRLPRVRGFRELRQGRACGVKPLRGLLLCRTGLRAQGDDW